MWKVKCPVSIVCLEAGMLFFRLSVCSSSTFPCNFIKPLHNRTTVFRVVMSWKSFIELSSYIPARQWGQHSEEQLCASKIMQCKLADSNNDVVTHSQWMTVRDVSKQRYTTRLLWQRKHLC